MRCLLEKPYSHGHPNETQPFSQPCQPHLVLYMLGSRSTGDLGLQTLPETHETRQANVNYSARPWHVSHLKDHLISDIKLPPLSMEMYTFISSRTEVPGR